MNINSIANFEIVLYSNLNLIYVHISDIDYE